MYQSISRISSKTGTNPTPTNSSSPALDFLLTPDSRLPTPLIESFPRVVQLLQPAAYHWDLLDAPTGLLPLGSLHAPDPVGSCRNLGDLALTLRGSSPPRRWSGRLKETTKKGLPECSSRIRVRLGSFGPEQGGEAVNQVMILPHGYRMIIMKMRPWHRDG